MKGVAFATPNLRMSLLVKCRIGEVNIFLIHLLLGQTHSFTKPLEMDDLPLSQETDRVTDIGVVGHAQNIIIGKACLLFRGHILTQVSNNVTSGLHTGRSPGIPRCGGGVNAGGVIYEIGSEGTVLDLFLGKVAGQLMDNRADHFKMAQFFRTRIAVTLQHSNGKPCPMRVCGFK